MHLDVVDENGQVVRKAPGFCGGCPVAANCNGPLKHTDGRVVEIANSDRTHTTYGIYLVDQDGLTSSIFGVQENEIGLYDAAEPPVSFSERSTTVGDKLTKEAKQKIGYAIMRRIGNCNGPSKTATRGTELKGPFAVAESCNALSPQVVAAIFNKALNVLPTE